MTDVTEADRDQAWLVLCALPISIPGFSPETVRKAQDHLAAVLAEERAKARAPFLRIAKEIDPVVALTVHARSDRDIAARIRRAAEEDS